MKKIHLLLGAACALTAALGVSKWPAAPLVHQTTELFPQTLPPATAPIANAYQWPSGSHARYNLTCTIGGNSNPLSTDHPAPFSGKFSATLYLHVLNATQDNVTLIGLLSEAQTDTGTNLAFLERSPALIHLKTDGQKESVQFSSEVPADEQEFAREMISTEFVIRPRQTTWATDGEEFSGSTFHSSYTVQAGRMVYKTRAAIPFPQAPLAKHNKESQWIGQAGSLWLESLHAKEAFAVTTVADGKLFAEHEWSLEITRLPDSGGLPPAITRLLQNPALLKDFAHPPLSERGAIYDQQLQAYRGKPVGPTVQALKAKGQSGARWGEFHTSKIDLTWQLRANPNSGPELLQLLRDPDLDTRAAAAITEALAAADCEAATEVIAAIMHAPEEYPLDLTLQTFIHLEDISSRSDFPMQALLDLTNHADPDVSYNALINAGLVTRTRKELLPAVTSRAEALVAQDDPRQRRVGWAALGNTQDSAFQTQAAAVVRSEEDSLVRIAAMSVLENTPTSAASDSALVAAMSDEDDSVAVAAMFAASSKNRSGVGPNIRARLQEISAEPNQERAKAAREALSELLTNSR